MKKDKVHYWKGFGQRLVCGKNILKGAPQFLSGGLTLKITCNKCLKKINKV